MLDGENHKNIHIYKLKGQFVWAVKEKSTDSWVWRKLLRLRDELQHCIKVEVGSGNGLYDNWHSWGPLHNVLTKQEITSMRIQDTDTVDDVVHKNFCVVGRRGIPRILELQSNLPVLISRKEDKIVWMNDGMFSCAKAWNVIRQ
ncbi:hypothetical protein LIER_08631 [Lithospermum erythrorhizon]|uniref:Uncharacterized protein n=1 Tax=Lithospermum erythrorhizon TaxID=34254 RepID=A0AAV3PCV3_LITER